MSNWGEASDAVNATAILSITLALITYGLISRKIAGSILTGPILFSVFGLIAGPVAFGLIPLQISNEALHLLAEVTLILVLFSDVASIYEFAESEGQILILLTFSAFGAAMIPQAIATVTLAHILFGVLALTVLRMLPIYPSLIGTGIKPVTSAFLGWFGSMSQRMGECEENRPVSEEPFTPPPQRRR